MRIDIKDKFSKKLIRTIDAVSGELLSAVIARAYDHARVTAVMNDRIVISGQWPHTTITDADSVVLMQEPKAAAVPFIIKAVATVAVNYLVSELTQPEPDNYQTSATGDSIYQSSRSTNSPRMGMPPPELFGTFRMVPDLISAPFLYYDDNTQYRCMLLCCGVGEYDINTIRIGDTDVSRLTGIDISVFNPGDDVTSHPAHRHVYTSQEVGGTSASEGLTLESGGYQAVGGANDVMPADCRYFFIDGDNQIQVYEPDESGQFKPRAWSLNYVVGDILRITTDFNSGIYIVDSFDANVNRMFVTDTDGNTVEFTGTAQVEATIERVTAIPEGDWVGPFLGCPEGVTTTQGEVDLIYRGGLGEEQNNGTISSRTVTTELQWREFGSTDDNDWVSVTISKTAATRDDLADTIPVDYGATPITPEVRMRRTSASSDSNTVRDSVQWQYLKSELTPATSYANVTVMAVRIAIDQGIAAQASNVINTDQQRRLPVPLSANAWSDAQPTNSIAAAYAYLLRRSGHPDNVIRTQELFDLHTLWAGRGDECNGVIDTPTTLFPALKRVLQPGYTEPYLRGGQVWLVRDQPRTAYGQFFSETNTHSIKEIGTLQSYNEFDGVRVEYTDPDTGIAAYVDCVIDGAAGVNMQTTRLLFCTSRTAAWRWGMRQAAKNKYLRTRWEISTEQEALNVDKGEMCTVIHHNTQCGVCYGYEDGVFLVNDALEITDGVTHYVGLRKRDGKVSGPYACELTTAGDIRLVDAGALDFTPIFDAAEDPPLYSFGTIDDWSRPVIAESVKGGGESASIVASKYDVRVYANDDVEPSF